MKIAFSKLQTLSCDFVIPKEECPIPREELARMLGKSKTALFPNAILFPEINTLPDGESICGMSAYDYHGSSCSPSGEALRAAGAYLRTQGFICQSTARLLCGGRIYSLSFDEKNPDQISLTLPSPCIDTHMAAYTQVQPLGQRLLLDGRGYSVYSLTVDRPYTVLLEFDTPLELLNPIKTALSLLRYSLYSKGEAIVFAEITSSTSLSARIFDTHEGELLASSGGAAAAVAVAQMCGLLPIGIAIEVQMRGGSLILTSEGIGAPFISRGEAHLCFEGRIDL